MINLQINQHNYKNIFRLSEEWRKRRIEVLEIASTGLPSKLVQFRKAAPFLYKLLDFEAYFEIWLKNTPFCILADDTRDHILNDENFKGEKLPKCKKCFYFKKCSGFPQGYFKKYGTSEVQPIKDLPCEVMIEVEPRCNFKCQSCFNQISFAKKGRNIKSFSTSYVKKIIDGIDKTKIKIIRLTGGEPLLRKDIFQLLKYAKDKGLEVRLNTNASLINQRIVQKLRGIVDNILIPIGSYSDEKESKITGYAHSLKKKIKAIELLRKAEIPIVRSGTVMTKENILNFDKIAQLISKLPLDGWEFYRPIPVLKKKNLNPGLIKLLAEKIVSLRKKIEKKISIANALPFCVIKDLNKMNSVSQGALYDEGHSRLVVDPRGFIKPDYFIDENLGHPLDILSAWQHPFVKKMRNLEYLPQECQDCPFAFKCRGGSRQAAKMIYGNYQALDPLANPKNAL